MGRREEREELQATWMVMREPRDLTGNRHERRKRVAQVRRPSASAVESSEARRPPAPRDSAADSEGG